MEKGSSNSHTKQASEQILFKDEEPITSCSNHHQMPTIQHKAHTKGYKHLFTCFIFFLISMMIISLSRLPLYYPNGGLTKLNYLIHHTF